MSYYMYGAAVAAEQTQHRVAYRTIGVHTKHVARGKSPAYCCILAAGDKQSLSVLCWLSVLEHAVNCCGLLNLVKYVLVYVCVMIW